MSDTIRYAKDEDGVVVLTIDDPTQRANTMNAAFVAALGGVLDRLQGELDEVAGIVITSGKPTFFAGGDLNDLIATGPEDADAVTELAGTIKSHLRRLETLGRPVVAAINGTALGGGLEICLATHHRVAVDSPKLKLGFPEVRLGLLPGAGGVARSVRMLGIVDALVNWLLEGREHAAAKAMELGLVDELVPAEADLLAAAKRWIGEHPEAAQPWDVKGYRIPGGTPSTPAFARNLPALPATLRRQLKGANYPAPKAIMAAAVEGAQVDFENAAEIEGRYFVSLVTGPVSKNMIQAFFFDMQEVNGDRGRGAEERRECEKVVVVGAGMMGAAIAYVAARAGIEVVLIDVTMEAAERGRSYSEGLVAKGRVTPEAGAELLARITPATDYGLAAGADLVIEAVVEDPVVKRGVFEQLEPRVAADAVLGSNTSTLPISELAEHVSRPRDFIGLHFFSPVDKMPLLEIVKGRETSEETLNRALDLAKQIRKTPIVVNDSRGFFTSRVIGTFLNEGIAMLAEGVPAATIEQASSQAGYPAPVLQLCDELNLGLMRKIRLAAEAAGERSGFDNHASNPVIDRMLDEFERPGKLAGKGFYDYEDGRRTRIWPGLAEAYPAVADPAGLSLADLEERLLFAESIEAFRCLDEGVIETIAEGNVGSILGIGFPGWTGGVFQYAFGYEGGVAGFVERARELTDLYGERFSPPDSLLAKTLTPAA